MTARPAHDAGPSVARGHAVIETLRTTGEGHALADLLDRRRAERRAAVSQLTEHVRDAR